MASIQRRQNISWNGTLDRTVPVGFRLKSLMYSAAWSFETTLGECLLQHISIQAGLEPSLNSFFYSIKRQLSRFGLRGNIKGRANSSNTVHLDGPKR